MPQASHYIDLDAYRAYYLTWYKEEPWNGDDDPMRVAAGPYHLVGRGEEWAEIVFSSDTDDPMYNFVSRHKICDTCTLQNRYTIITVPDWTVYQK